MLCIRKQLGTIFAVASPAVLSISGFLTYTEFVDPEFLMTGAWLGCMFGFIAVLMVTGAQRRYAIPAPYCLMGAISIMLVGVVSALAFRDNFDASALVFGAWRTAAVVAMTGLVVSIFAAAQLVWRYASANHPNSLAACSGLFKSVTLR